MGSAAVIRVECYCGYRGDETPRRFTDGERRIEVREVVDAWLGPDHRSFKVTGDDGFTYLLRHDMRTGGWSLAGKSSSHGGVHRARRAGG